METNKSPTLIVIPARGGSKEIPRKNLKLLGGTPLIQYVLSTISTFKDYEIVVSTDDAEIEYLATTNGVRVIPRPPEFATDQSTLDEVIINAVKQTETITNNIFEKIITIQPTSPFISKESIMSAILSLDDADCVISVRDSRHLRWTTNQDGPTPLYDQRINRQWLPPNWSETGGIIGCSKEILNSGSRIGGQISLLELSGAEALDIDTHTDWALAESLLSTPKIAIRVIGDTENGLGHTFRGLTIADRLNTKPIFITDAKSSLAKELILSRNYECEEYSTESELVEILLERKVEVLLNDILDTTNNEIEFLKNSTNCIIVNFEDLGSGSAIADVTFNALYEHENPLPNQRYGWEWFCARDEFCNLEQKDEHQNQTNVLITFGGTDPRDLTTGTLNYLSQNKDISKNLDVNVILGPGNKNKEQIEDLVKKSQTNFHTLTLMTEVPRISKYMQAADIAITSNGRTVFEIATCNTPMITISQNERETLHTFSRKCKGAIDLGYSTEFPTKSFGEAIRSLVTDNTLHKQMKTNLSAYNLTSGTERVISEITRLYKNRGRE